MILFNSCFQSDWCIIAYRYNLFYDFLSARFKNIEFVLNIWKWENECSSSTPILWRFEHIISANDDTFKRNENRLKEYKSKLILFLLKGGKHKKGIITRGLLHISVKTNIEFGIFIYFYIVSIFLKRADYN